jgi:hypothetical protein
MASQKHGETYDVWISRDEMVDFLLYAASLDASVATRSKISDGIRQYLRKLEWFGLHTVDERVKDGHGTVGNTSVWVNLLQN